jgi:hypothetical protein
MNRLWWFVAVLAMLVGLFVGATIQRTVDHRNAARDLYRTQLLTTFSRFLDEEHRQLALPPAKRSAAAFLDVADGINNDPGVNGQGTLEVNSLSGSAGPSTQVAFAARVSSPYGTTTIAIWSILVTTQTSSGTDDGVCVLWSSLLGSGSGRATTNLDLGGGEFVPSCSPAWWRGPITITHPNLGMAGIKQSGE